MNHTSRTFLLVLLAAGSLTASAAQPKFVKTAAKSTCSVTTYDADGALLGSGQGFFLADGQLLTSYDLFRSAATAVTVDAAGVSRPVGRIVGAHELYGVVRAIVPTDKKFVGVTADSVVVTAGERLCLLPPSTTKKGSVQWLQVTDAVAIADSCRYYTLTRCHDGSPTPPVSTLATAQPLFTADGRLAAMLQPVTDGDTLFYALDTRFATSLSIKALTLNEPSYRNLRYPKRVPETLDQAQVYLFLASSMSDRDYVADIIDAFVEQYPTHYDGYLERYKMDIERQDYDAADADGAQALACATGKSDEVHYQLARGIFTTLVADSTFTRDGWTMERVVEELKAAIDSVPLQSYYQELADVYAYNEKYRAAVGTLILMEQLEGFQGTEEFYYYREQLESRCRMYQQALDDIDRCVALRPTRAAYRLEKAVLNIRVGRPEVARPLLEDLMEEYPDDITCRNLYDTYCKEQ